MAVIERKLASDPLGLHRVMDAKRCLPQAAEKLDNSLPLFSNEILLKVERLNIDAASFIQMEQETGGNVDRIGRIVMENTQTRGKQQNRVTGSGGMLVGSVAQIGSHYRGPLKCRVGDRVASLISLTLTPLHLDRIRQVHLENHQIDVDGHAILFQSSIAVKIPDEIEEAVAMAVFDVAGAPKTTYDLSRPKQRLVVIGAGGKAGILSCVAARQKMGRSGKIIGIEPVASVAKDLASLGVCDDILSIDATDPIAVRDGVFKATKGKMADLVVNVASVPNTENSALLAATPRAKILFFSMATSFPKVALGAEGIALQASLLIGNGYAPNHAKFAIDLVKARPALLELFRRRYGSRS